MSGDRACRACSYFDRMGSTGICRRQPPRQVFDARNEIKADWPPVRDDDWCGEFAPTPARPRTLPAALQEEFG